jgi:hypothetical protein
MARRGAVRNRGRSSRGKRNRRLRFTRYLPSAATRRRWWRRYRGAPPWAQFVIAVVGVLTLWLCANWIYQVVRKPSELFFPVSGTLYKVPAETWDAYAPIFRKHSTAAIGPEYLAALAQVEGSGNPIVRTYWRWSWRPQPFEMYRPASSAVGMYQITDGTYEEARRYCVHDHVVVDDGPWDDWNSCWFNSLYVRVVPSHAVEMTSAYLDRSVARILERRRIRSATVQQKQDLASVIHLCGAGAGDAYARRGLRITPGQRCGDHDVRTYVQRVNAMKRQFARLAVQDD